jgi:microcystin-dependent protein
MGAPYVGEIQYVGFSFAPFAWAFCNGQLMSIAQDEALYALIGTTYGGDGVSTFGLPNMQSRAPIHQGTGLGLSTYVMGQVGGSEEVTLTSSQMPQHTHALTANTTVATAQIPSGNMLAAGHDAEPSGAQTPKIYIPAASTTVGTDVNLAAQSVGFAGGSQPFSVIQPILTVNCVISLFGIFPTRN